MSLDDQLRLLAQINPDEQNGGFGPGTPQYVNYRAMIDKGQSILDKQDAKFRKGDPFQMGGAGWPALVMMGGAAAGGALGGGAGGLSDVTVPSSGSYLAPIGGDAAGAAAATVGPSSALAGSAPSMAPEAAKGSWKDLFRHRTPSMNMGGGDDGGNYGLIAKAMADQAQDEERMRSQEHFDSARRQQRMAHFGR